MIIIDREIKILYYRCRNRGIITRAIKKTPPNIQHQRECPTIIYQVLYLNDFNDRQSAKRKHPININSDWHQPIL